MNEDWVAYQQGIEKFYSVIADVLREKGSMVSVGGSDYADVKDPDLLLFDVHLCYEPFGYMAELFLLDVMKRGYDVLMNFQAADVILGNVAVKIKDRWFAFGQCKNDSEAGPYVMDIWSLKHVLTNLKKMEATIRYVLPVESPSSS